MCACVCTNLMVSYCESCGKPQNRKQEKSLLLTGWRSSAVMVRELICIVSVTLSQCVFWCMCMLMMIRS